MEGKCPKDGRKRPVYIKIKGKRILAIADGCGNVFKTYSEDYPYLDECLPENMYDPEEYEFERGLSSHDF